MTNTTHRAPSPIIQTKDLELWFPQRGGVFGRVQSHNKAVNGISLDIFKGETLGLVGESGSGKSTLGKAILNLHRPTGGSVFYKGQAINTLSDREMRPLRQHLQIVFQDPMESMNPRMAVGAILEEPFIIHGIGTAKERQQYVYQLLDRVGLNKRAAEKYPHEFSGGQRQRIGIARAIALEPEFIVCDEAVSALDVSVQAQVLNLLLDLQEEMDLTLLFISHDIAVVRHMSDRIAVMYQGKIVETGDADDVCNNPAHSYSQKLLSAVPPEIAIV